MLLLLLQVLRLWLLLQAALAGGQLGMTSSCWGASGHMGQPKALGRCHAEDGWGFQAVVPLPWPLHGLCAVCWLLTIMSLL